MLPLTNENVCGHRGYSYDYNLLNGNHKRIDSISKVHKGYNRGRLPHLKKIILLPHLKMLFLDFCKTVHCTEIVSGLSFVRRIPLICICTNEGHQLSVIPYLYVCGMVMAVFAPTTCAIS